jgi:hypothetical protein
MLGNIAYILDRPLLVVLGSVTLVERVLDKTVGGSRLPLAAK